MQCSDVMKTDIVTIHEEDDLAMAARKMRDFGVGFLPVLDERGRPVGTITDRDVAIRAVAEDRLPSAICVEDVMTREVVSCDPDTDLRDAEEKMASARKSRLMICDSDGVLVGVISLSDVARWEDESSYAASTLRDIASREAPAPEP